MTWPEDESPLRLPPKRPLYAAGADDDDDIPSLATITSILPASIKFAPACLSPQATCPTLPVKLQVKFTDEPTDPFTVFP